MSTCHCHIYKCQIMYIYICLCQIHIYIHHTHIYNIKCVSLCRVWLLPGHPKSPACLPRVMLPERCGAWKCCHKRGSPHIYIYLSMCVCVCVFNDVWIYSIYNICNILSIYIYVWYVLYLNQLWQPRSKTINEDSNSGRLDFLGNHSLGSIAIYSNCHISSLVV